MKTLSISPPVFYFLLLTQLRPSLSVKCLMQNTRHGLTPCFLSLQHLSNRTTQQVNPVPYRRKLPVESLSQVENPWKGITLNRCIALAVIIVVVSSGVEQMQEALDAFMEVEDGLIEGADQLGSTLWDTVAFWNWGLEGDVPKRRSIRKKIQRRDPAIRLLKEKSSFDGLDGDGD